MSETVDAELEDKDGTIKTINTMIDDAMKYFGCTLDEFVDSLEPGLYKFFNEKIHYLEGAVLSMIKVSCQVKYNRGLYGFYSKGKEISFYFSPKEEESISGMYPDESKPLTQEVKENEIIQASLIVKPLHRPKKGQTKTSIIDVCFSFSYTFVNVSDDIEGRSDRVAKLVKGLFKIISDTVASRSNEILRVICENTRKSEVLRHMVIETKKKPPNKQSKMIEEYLIKIQESLLPKLALFMDEPGNSLDLMSVFVVWQDEDGGLKYLLTEQQKEFLSPTLTSRVVNLITTEAMPQESSICYTRLNVGVVGFIHNWGQLEIKKDLKGKAAIFLNAEQSFLKETVILLPNIKSKMLIGCSGPNLAKSKLYALPKVLKSLRRSVSSNQSLLNKLRQALEDRAVFNISQSNSIIGNSKRIKETRDQIVDLGAYLGELILQSYKEYCLVKRQSKNKESDNIFIYNNIFKDLAFPCILLSGPVGCGKTTHALVLRESIQKYLARNENRFPDSILPSEFYREKYISPNLDKNCSYYASEQSDVNMISSYFFGIEKGIASGVGERKGIFEDVSFGQVLFLDEIGDLHDQAQALLLDLIQTRRYFKLEKKPNARFFPGILMFATWKDVWDLRPDFYSRISDCIIEIPALNERREDIPAIVEDFVRNLGDINMERYKSILKECASRSDFTWSYANVRQLRKVLSHMSILIRSKDLAERKYLNESEIRQQFEAAYWRSQPKAPLQSASDLPIPCKNQSSAEGKKRDDIFFNRVTLDEWLEDVDIKAHGDKMLGQQYLFQRYGYPYCYTESVVKKKMPKLVEKLEVTQGMVKNYRGNLKS